MDYTVNIRTEQPFHLKHTERDIGQIRQYIQSLCIMNGQFPFVHRQRDGIHIALMPIHFLIKIPISCFCLMIAFNLEQHSENQRILKKRLFDFFGHAEQKVKIILDLKIFVTALSFPFLKARRKNLFSHIIGPLKFAIDWFSSHFIHIAEDIHIEVGQ